jgi:DNA-binding transcriptional MerR regulator
MPIQGEFFERPEIVIAATEETIPPPPAPINDKVPTSDEAPKTNPDPIDNDVRIAHDIRIANDASIAHDAPARRNMKDLSIPKLYYSISEVSRLTGLEPYVLRYWETEFDALRPQKNRAGNRVYSNRDIKFILRIKELLREKRYTIEGAKVILKSERGNDAKQQEEPTPSSDPAQIPLVSDAKPAVPTAFLTLQEIRTMKQSLLELRAIFVK